MNKRLRKGDRVMVMAGNEKGKIGNIISIAGERLVVEGVNIRKKHMKKREQNQKSQIIDIECSIHNSNVKICVDEKPVKIRARANKDGEKELYYLENDKEVVYRSIKKAANKSSS